MQFWGNCYHLSNLSWHFSDWAFLFWRQMKTNQVESLCISFWVTLPFAVWGQSSFAILCRLSTIKSTVTNRLLNIVDAKWWNVSNTNKHYAEVLAAQLQMTGIVLLKVFPWSQWTCQRYTGFVFYWNECVYKELFSPSIQFMYNWCRDVLTSNNVEDSLDFIHTTSSNLSWNLFGNTFLMTSCLT